MERASTSLSDATPRISHGLPAFESEKRFRLIDREPLLFLESETTEGLSFLLLPVTMIDPQYKLAISEDDRETLGADFHPACFASPWSPLAKTCRPPPTC